MKINQNNACLIYGFSVIFIYDDRRKNKELKKGKKL